MLWVDEDLGSSVYLDGVLCVVDSLFSNSNFDSFEFQRQIAYSDRIIFNKCDMITNNELLLLKQKISTINSTAISYDTNYSVCNEDFYFDLHCYDNKNRIIDFGHLKNVYIKRDVIIRLELYIKYIYE